MSALPFSRLGRLPAPGDNAAIATRRIAAGTRCALDGRGFMIPHAILEGHRFAVAPIARGDTLNSWGLPFGWALRDIRPGEYVCNAAILDALKLRQADFELPRSANFKNYLEPYVLDEAAFRPGPAAALYDEPGSFQGYLRPGGRGSGTRNTIVLLGTTSSTAGFVRALEARLRTRAAGVANVDGIVAVAHTEGGGGRRPNNLQFVLRTLAGFMVHPNVGAVLAVDYGSEAINNRMLHEYLREHGYPIDAVPHRFYSIDRGFAAALAAAERIVTDWLAPVSAAARTSRPLGELKVALQCGGSDAFSGISGNPLAGRVAGELIRHGGSAVLAETDELIGAEAYILANTRDLATAQRFLEKIAVFEQRAAWHGHSAEGNPSGGNKFRGLYNIAIKSIGAARKKDPDVRLDYVIDYGEPMHAPGFYFMDSPGNDLESIAGQVAAGCNLIFFITGNGSITNFPFAPTVKFVTTSGRWDLLSKDMDINAGRYLDGTPMDELADETFDYTLRVASGTRSAGERAGHAQVSIWREWRQTGPSRLDELQNRSEPSGVPIAIAPRQPPARTFRALPDGRGGLAADQVGLIVPTSLCSGQIARMIAERMNAGGDAERCGVSRFTTLVHSEGCGASGGENEAHYTRTLIGHLLHPFVREALLLEHGCERTHNDLLRHLLGEAGVEPARFGYASIQLDGGIEKVVDKVRRWFVQRLGDGSPPGRREVSVQALRLGVLTTGALPAPVARSLAAVVAAIAGSGGTVVVAGNSSLLGAAEFLDALGRHDIADANLDYGQAAKSAGLYLMATPTDHAVETLSGLGGAGAEVILAHVDGPPLPGHPMIPLVQAAAHTPAFADDFDLVLDPSTEASIEDALWRLVCDTASGTYRPKATAAGNTGFQITRGLLGVSL